LGHNDDLPAIVVCTMKNTRECVYRVDQSRHLFYSSLDAQMMMMMMCGWWVAMAPNVFIDAFTSNPPPLL